MRRLSIFAAVAFAVFLHVAFPAGAQFQAHAQPADSTRKYAVLVGVSRYTNEAIPKLKAPGNDVKRMWEFLAGWKFAPENVTVLADDLAAFQGTPPPRVQRPTAANILKALDDLVRRLETEKATEKPFVTFYFSGHGTYHREDRSKKKADVAPEPDGNDEALLAIDAGNLDTGLGRIEGSILDDELKERLDKLQKLAFVWVILDSCHAGGSTRSATGDDVIYKSVDPEALGARAYDPSRDPPLPVQPLQDLRKRPEWVPETTNGSLVAFLAVNEDAKAIERKMKVDGLPGENFSIFTHFLLQALQQPGLVSYRQVAFETQALISKHSQHNPTPVFQGDLDRKLDGQGIVWAARLEGNAVRIEAGSLVGLSNGSIVALERAGLPGAATERVACAKLTRVQPAWSDAAAVACPGSPQSASASAAAPVPTGAVEAKLTARVIQPVVAFQLVVARPPQLQCEPTTARKKGTAKPPIADLASVNAAIEQLKADGMGLPVEFVAAGQPALIQLCVRGDVVYYVGENGRLEIGIRRRTAGRSTSVPVATLVDNLRQDLWKILRQQNLLRIARETAAAEIASKVKIDVRLVRDAGVSNGAGDRERRECTQRPLPSDSKSGKALRRAISPIVENGSQGAITEEPGGIAVIDDRLTHCDQILVTVANRSGKDVDVTLLYLDSDAGIGAVGKSAEGRIGKDDKSARIFGIQLVTWCGSGQWRECREQEGRQPPKPAYAPVGTERLAVVVAESSGPERTYYALTQEGLGTTRSAARSSENRFDKLLEDAGIPGGLRTRGIDRGGDATIRIFQWEVVPPGELATRSAR